MSSRSSYIILAGTSDASVDPGGQTRSVSVGSDRGPTNSSGCRGVTNRPARSVQR